MNVCERAKLCVLHVVMVFALSGAVFLFLLVSRHGEVDTPRGRVVLNARASLHVLHGGVAWVVFVPPQICVPGAKQSEIVYQVYAHPNAS